MWFRGGSSAKLRVMMLHHEPLLVAQPQCVSVPGTRTANSRPYQTTLTAGNVCEMRRRASQVMSGAYAEIHHLNHRARKPAIGYGSAMQTEYEVRPRVWSWTGDARTPHAQHLRRAVAMTM